MSDPTTNDEGLNPLDENSSPDSQSEHSSSSTASNQQYDGRQPAPSSPYGQSQQYGQTNSDASTNPSSSYTQQQPYNASTNNSYHSATGQQQPNSNEHDQYGSTASNAQYGQNPSSGYNQQNPQYGYANASFQGQSGYGYTGNQQYAAPVPAMNKPYYGIPFVEACKRFFQKYAIFSGRASKSEFWWAYLMVFGVSFVLEIFNSASNDHLGFIGTIWSLGTFVPMLAIMSRRLHDTNKSAWWMALPMGLTAAMGIFAAVFIGAAALSVFSAFGSSRSAVGLSGGAAVFGILLALACGIGALVTYIVLFIANSDPAGARYDDDAQYPQAGTGTAYGQSASYGQNANYGQNAAYGQAPTEQNTFGQNAYGQNQAGQSQSGQPNTYGQSNGYEQPGTFDQPNSGSYDGTNHNQQQ
jgi:uncharacterized membrane protein YhaH (DUF805 family)